MFQTFPSFSGPPSQLELRSSGGAGEYWGDRLGLYQLLLGGGAGRTQDPVYQQMHNTNDKEHNYIYRWDNSCTAQHNICCKYFQCCKKFSLKLIQSYVCSISQMQLLNRIRFVIQCTLNSLSLSEPATSGM